MVHAIKMLKCKNGHLLPISLDNNECGCHHDGKPCIIISCRTCFENSLKNLDTTTKPIYIPLDEEGMKELKKQIQGGLE